MAEEVIFRDIVQRGTDVIQRQLLRYVRWPDALVSRFHQGMTLANTYSHDNPAADTAPIPSHLEFAEYISELEVLISNFNAESEAAEADRPQMKLKK